MNWLYVYSEDYYDIEGAYNNLPFIDWRRKSSKIKTGDIIYLYSSLYESVKYKLKVENCDIDLSETIDDSKYSRVTDPQLNNYKKFIRTSLIKKSNSYKLHIDNLRNNGLDFNATHNGNVPLTETIVKYLDEAMEVGSERISLTLAGEYCLKKLVYPILTSPNATESRKQQAKKLISPFVNLPKTGDIWNYMKKRIDTDRDGTRSSEINLEGFDSFETFIGNFEKKFSDELGEFTEMSDLFEGKEYQKNILQAAINNDNRQAGMLYIYSKSPKKENGIFIIDYQNGSNYKNIWNEESNELIYYLWQNKGESEPNITSGINYILINNKLPIHFAQKNQTTGLFKYIGQFRFERWADNLVGKAALLKKVNSSEEYEEKEDKIINDFNTIISNLGIEDLITTSDAIVKVRIGQGKFRDKLIEKYNGKCCISGIDVKELLVASHIKPWSESNNFERWDINNGLLLCTHYDKLFDKHLISFEDNGNIIISNIVPDKVIDSFNLRGVNIKVSDDMKKYLYIHRSNLK